MRRAGPIALDEGQRGLSAHGSRGRKSEARLVLLAKTILSTSEGMQREDIAAQVGTDVSTLERWRSARVALAHPTAERLASVLYRIRVVHVPTIEGPVLWNSSR